MVVDPQFDDRIRMKGLTLMYDLVVSDENIVPDDPDYVRNTLGDQMMIPGQLFELLE